MRRFQNILLVDEGTLAGPAASAAHEAAALAMANNARFTLHSVVPEAPLPQDQLRLGDNEQPISEILKAERATRLAALAATLDLDDVRVSVAIGSPAREVVRRVVQAHHDLVIVLADSSEASASTVRQILRMCPCPVWALKPGFTGERILAAVDPDDDPALNRLILELAGSQAARYGGELRVVHAWEPYGRWVFLNSEYSDASSQMVASFAADAETAHRRALDEALRSAGISADVSIHLIEGPPERAISGMIRLYRTDLLVMGSVGSVEPEQVLVGSTADQILNNVECSVLTAKPPGFVSPLAVRPGTDHRVVLDDSTRSVAEPATT